MSTVASITPTTISYRCRTCGDSGSVPNQGPGRATYHAWKTHHRHDEDKVE